MDTENTSIKTRSIVIAVCFVAFLIGVFFGMPYMVKRYQEGHSDIKEIVAKKNAGEALNEEENLFFEKAVAAKQEERRIKISTRPREGMQTYTQEEANFLTDPRGTIEKELGIVQGANPPKSYTQEEMDRLTNVH